MRSRGAGPESAFEGGGSGSRNVSWKAAVREEESNAAAPRVGGGQVHRWTQLEGTDPPWMISPKRATLLLQLDKFDHVFFLL